jgi:hypothetical protein
VTRPWRVAGSLLVLLGEVNHRWPDRDKSSDGTIGDARHQAEGWTASDHNPWVVDSQGNGVVRALDVDAGPGLNPDAAHDTIGQTVADAAVAAAKAGHPAMGDGSYVIWHGQIASVNSVPPWSWRPYTGADPHTSHPHISVATHQAGYDSTRPWGVWPLPLPKPPGKPPTLRQHGRNYPAWTKHLQHLLNAHGGPHLAVDGDYGPATVARVKAFKRRHNIWPATGTTGRRVWQRLGVK